MIKSIGDIIHSVAQREIFQGGGGGKFAPPESNFIQNLSTTISSFGLQQSYQSTSKARDIKSHPPPITGGPGGQHAPAHPCILFASEVIAYSACGLVYIQGKKHINKHLDASYYYIYKKGRIFHQSDLKMKMKKNILYFISISVKCIFWQIFKEIVENKYVQEERQLLKEFTTKNSYSLI